MKKKIKVLIADDHAMVRDGLCRVLEDTDDIAVVGQADNGLTALSLAKKTKPDVVVLDYTMPSSTVWLLRGGYWIFYLKQRF
jgi:DNA-binding NarL/FixJ family response regulator